jgi:hypothetical protein
MAQDANALFAPWVDMCAVSSSTSLGSLNFAGGTGGLAAVNPATGAVIWKHSFKALDIGAATVANDIVFTSTFNGASYALSTKDGSALRSAKASTGINSFPAVTKTMFIVGAGAPSAAKNATNDLIRLLAGRQVAKQAEAPSANAEAPRQSVPARQSIQAGGGPRVGRVYRSFSGRRTVVLG